MDTTSAIVSAAVGQTKLSNQISVAVAKTALDTQKAAGAAAVELIAAAADVQKQSQRVSVSNGRVDGYA